MKTFTIGEGTCCDNAEKLRAANQRIKELEANRDETVADYVVSIMEDNSIDNFTAKHFKTNDGREFELVFRFVDGESYTQTLYSQKQIINKLSSDLQILLAGLGAHKQSGLEYINQQKKRDLEQQAKGVEIATIKCESWDFGWQGDCGISSELDWVASELRKQAEDL